MLLAIDSGGNAGWALFDGKELLECGLRTDPFDVPRTWQNTAFERIVIERPHAGKTRARAKDVITLAVRAGEVGGLLRYLSGVEPEYIEPQRWKGQLPKKLCNKITKAKLSPQELILLKNIGPKSAEHNVLDAIGIGLFLVGR